MALPKDLEVERMLKIKDKSQAIGEFLDWLSEEKSIELAYWVGNDLCPSHVPYEQLLAEFFDIDLNAAENERRSLLAQLRKAAAKPKRRVTV